MTPLSSTSLTSLNFCIPVFKILLVSIHRYMIHIHVMNLDKELLEKIVSMDDPQDLALFLEEMLTPSELDDLSKRWQLMKDLYRGIPQRRIAKKHGISLCKITRGSKILKNRDSITLKMLQNL